MPHSCLPLTSVRVCLAVQVRGVWELCVSRVEEHQTVPCVKADAQFTFPRGVYGNTHDLCILINASQYLPA